MIILDIMKASIFSPILILLILTLFAKASVLFGRIHEKTTYAMDTSTSTILVNGAYAQATNIKKPNIQKKEQAVTQIKPIEPEQKGWVINNLIRSEIELLKEISKRRDSLDKEKSTLNIREQVLKATEDIIDKKKFQSSKRCKLNLKS